MIVKSQPGRQASTVVVRRLLIQHRPTLACALHAAQARRAPGCTELLYMFDGDKVGLGLLAFCDFLLYK